MKLIVDQAERLRAIDPEQSFIVSAPAGSGKTGLITHRILRLLSIVNQPEEILSITFTKKAAAEMASRVHEALNEAAVAPRPDDTYAGQTWDLAKAALDRDHILNWNLVEMPNRLRIKTIDSFCRYIAAQFSLESELDDMSEPSENPDIHYQNASRSLMNKLEKDENLRPKLSALLTHTGNDLERCQRLLSELLGKREQWLPLIYDIQGNRNYFQQVIEHIVKDSLLSLQELIMPVAEEFIELADFAARHVPKDKNPLLHELTGIDDLPDTNIYGLNHWRVLLGLLVTKAGKFRSKPTINDGFPPKKPEQKKRMEQILAWCREQINLQNEINNILYLPSEVISKKQQTLLDALGYILPKLAAELIVEFKECEVCDYPAVTLAALDAIRPNEGDSVSDITLRLDYKIRHILVDEFQDTSSSQTDLLTSLVNDWQPDDGRTLFLVGDAMQSMYSFRNANVGLFINSQRHPIGSVKCIPLTLSTNFRSDQGVIDWVNDIFGKSFPKLPDISRGAVPYTDSVAFKPLDYSPAVNFIGLTGDSCAQEEAKQIVTACQSILAKNKNESIAILVRSRNHLKEIIPALRSHKISYEAHDISKLATNMSVLDLLSLTRALISPADRISWLSVLRAPFCGLGLKDLLTISNSTQRNLYLGDNILDQLNLIRDQPCAKELSSYGRSALDRVIPVLNSAWEQRWRLNLRWVVENTWIALGGLATVPNGIDLRDIFRYLDLLESQQVSGVLRDQKGFELAVDRLFAYPNLDYFGNSNHKIDVQIMTIHKSKGLEFDHVFLPCLASKSASDKKPLLRWQKLIDKDNNPSLLMAPLGAHDDDDDPVYSYLHHEQSLRLGLENTRVAYVAATRAIKKLYLYAELNPSKKEDWRAPAKTSLLSPLWKEIKQRIDRNEYTVIETQHLSNHDRPKENPSLTHIRRLPSNFKSESITSNALLVMNDLADIENRNLIEEELSPKARHLGTILHRALKQIATDGTKNWSLSRIEGLSSSWRAQLRELGTLASDEDLNRLTRAVSLMMQDATGQWILAGYPNSSCEQSLNYLKSDGLTFGTSIIDRTFIDRGVRWIIDYKFTNPKTGELLHQFKIRQINSYKDQLSHYAGLYRELGDEPVRCALYFPELATFTEVQVD
jgi:ATP-dependent exoDNAse (exonuclease V) beta subunit